MRRRGIPSISVPIILAAVAVPLSITLLVGWTLVTLQNATLSRNVAQNIWLLVLGVVSFVVITGVLVMFSVFLIREILEVRRQTTFIDSVTHELKSPLASLKLCLETLSREGVKDEQREQLRRMMRDDVERLSAFTDDILQASRASHERARLDLSDVGLHDLIAKCVDNVVTRYRIDPGCVVVDVPHELRVSTDRALLEIVIKNLIDNAVKYSDSPVDVTVTARLDPQRRAIIEVRDRGIGIPPKQLKRVFYRFHRVPSEQVRARRGTGLGLFVVSALVRNLGGRVEADSPGIGYGTTMRVRLPAADAK